MGGIRNHDTAGQENGNSAHARNLFEGVRAGLPGAGESVLAKEAQMLKEQDWDKQEERATREDQVLKEKKGVETETQAEIEEPAVREKDWKEDDDYGEDYQEDDYGEDYGDEWEDDEGDSYTKMAGFCALLLLAGVASVHSPMLLLHLHRLMDCLHVPCMVLVAVFPTLMISFFPIADINGIGMVGSGTSLIDTYVKLPLPLFELHVIDQGLSAPYVMGGVLADLVADTPAGFLSGDESMHDSLGRHVFAFWLPPRAWTSNDSSGSSKKTSSNGSGVPWANSTNGYGRPGRALSAGQLEQVELLLTLVEEDVHTFCGANFPIRHDSDKEGKQRRGEGAEEGAKEGGKKGKKGRGERGGNKTTRSGVSRTGSWSRQNRTKMNRANKTAECVAFLLPAARTRLVQAASRGYRPIIFDMAVKIRQKALTLYFHDQDVPSIVVDSFCRKHALLDQQAHQGIQRVAGSADGTQSEHQHHQWASMISSSASAAASSGVDSDPNNPSAGGIPTMPLMNTTLLAECERVVLPEVINRWTMYHLVAWIDLVVSALAMVLTMSLLVLRVPSVLRWAVCAEMMCQFAPVLLT
jgi:hypothetical protein